MTVQTAVRQFLGAVPILRSSGIMVDVVGGVKIRPSRPVFLDWAVLDAVAAPRVSLSSLDSLLLWKSLSYSRYSCEREPEKEQKDLTILGI